jgi:hypothetical protein
LEAIIRNLEYQQELSNQISDKVVDILGGKMSLSFILIGKAKFISKTKMQHVLLIARSTSVSDM